MSTISTHILDLARGAPAPGVAVALLRLGADGHWFELGRAVTDADGRVRNLLPPGTAPSAGTYRLRFETGPYFLGRGARGFYPEVVVTFEAADGSPLHVPLLLSPFGYSTYRGS